MNDVNTDFWVKIINKMDFASDNSALIPELLEDICQFFNFACSFVYQADYTSIFSKKYYYQSCNFEHLENALDLKNILGEDLFKELSLAKVLRFSKKTIKTILQEKLGKIFKANSLILIPIKDPNDEIVAFIGLADRREENRKTEVNLNDSYAVLSLLATNVKLEISHTRVTNAEKTLRNVLDHVGIDIYVNDYHNHTILYVNKSMAVPYGGVDQMLGRKCWDIIFNDKDKACEFCPQPKLLDESGNPTNIYSWDYQRPFDGLWFHVLSSAFPWIDGRMAHLIASVDITESKQNELLVQKMANYDHLTGLANRRKLLDEIDTCIKNEDKSPLSNSWYMLFCDLDGFKQINDTIGHRAGDQLLKAIGTRLCNNHSIGKQSYRHGGDEFIVLLPDQYSTKQLLEILRGLMIDFTSTCTFENHEISCGCSIGVVHFPSDGTTTEDLLHRADMAMYASKKAGKGTIRFYNKGEIVTSENYFKHKEFHGTK